MAEWRSVKDGLPDRNAECIAYSELSNTYFLGHIEYLKPWECVVCENKSGIAIDITHWIPLPEAPKGDR